MAETNPLLSRLFRHLKVELDRLPVTSENLSLIQSDMNSAPTASNVECNFGVAAHFIQQCDNRCELWAARIGTTYHGFMLLRHGLQSDLRWLAPETMPSPGFVPSVAGFDHERVLDILVLCSHGGPRGIGQLLVLTALAMAHHGVFLQLSIRMERVPNQSRMGSEQFLVVRHVYLDAAKHIYDKLGFVQVPVHDNQGQGVGGIYYYRPNRLTDDELTQHLKHLEKYGVVVSVPRATDSGLPDRITDDTLPLLQSGLTLQHLSGPSGLSLEDDTLQPPVNFDNFDAWGEFPPDLLDNDRDPVLDRPPQGVFELDGNDNDLAFPGAGPNMVDNQVVGSHQALLQVVPSQHPSHIQGPRIVPPPRRPAPKKKKKKQPVRRRRGHDDSSSSSSSSESSSSEEEEEEEEQKVPRPRGRPAKAPVSLKCDECGKTFANANNLKRHLKAGHREDRRRSKYVAPSAAPARAPAGLVCPSCGRYFNRSDNLKRHVKEVHTADKDQRRQEKKEAVCSESEGCQYECRICGTKFHGAQAYSNWIRHNSSVHGKGRKSHHRRAQQEGAAAAASAAPSSRALVRE